MRFKTNKGLVATSLALALASFGTAHATDAILFDPDGTAAANPTYSVGSFDWTVNSALANESGTNPQDFTLYFHAALNGLVDAGGNPFTPIGLNAPTSSGFEITVVGGFRESITLNGPAVQTRTSLGADGIAGTSDDVYKITQNANLKFVEGSSGSSFIQLFYDTFSDGTGQRSDALTGLGYADGLKILEARITNSTGTIANSMQYNDLNGNQLFDAGDTLVSVKLDSFGIDQWPGILTADADGSTSLVADIFGTPDANFFLSPLAQILQNLDFTTETNLPFLQTNPSQSFDDGAGGFLSLLNTLLNVGTCNGCILDPANQGPDFILQADASNAFTRAVPEPNVLGLLGLGLMGLALSRRKASS